MTEADLQTLTWLVLALGFAIGAAFGAIAQHTRFCTMGAVTDVAIIGDWTRMRLWGVAMGTAIIGFNAMVGLGWVAAADSIYAGSRIAWLSALAGGLVFGAGMVLASGCASKNLMRAGAGNLKSVVVLLVIALTGFATLKGITAVLRVNTVDAVYAVANPSQDLPSLASASLATSLPATAAVLGLGVGALLLVASLLPRVERSWTLALGGIALGLLITAAWYVSGVIGHIEEHPATLESAFLATTTRRMEGLSFVAAVSYAADYLLFFSDATKALTLGIVSALGVVIGAMTYALFTRTFHWEGFGGVPDLRNHLAGATLMGVGGVTAFGCTIGQGLTGISTLSVTSFIAVASTIAGAFATVRFMAWRLDRQDQEPLAAVRAAG